ncbi:hypothetical protein MPSI1_002461 [Malassezia psittaci]|uniref:Major facilitator superfamily (MFS) profile domain-containing protein n=1 Tax=Malassezia psittaci TaxID=1821823 RepID=A0AAF0JE98_9BASI|nr:hypothetical protein MPSI1_002461 [Malassezia psittaci]
MSVQAEGGDLIRPVDRKFTWRKFGTIVACGAALFSDGYANNSMGTVNTILKKHLYPDVFKNSNRSETMSAIVFAGTVVGMLIFGYLSDTLGRKNGMIIATLIILIFTALSAGSYYKGDHAAMVDMLIAWRFLTGIGIGAEYPTGSVAAAEKTEEMPKTFQHGPFIFVTNFAIDMGFVVSAFMGVLLVWICGADHTRLIWRLVLGLGVVPCLIVLPFRLAMEQTKSYQQNSIKYNQIPYKLILKRYWFRLMIISLVWFIYDFISYPFGIYSSIITDALVDSSSLVQVFGWSTVINCFYLPGSFLGALFVDRLGPKKTMIIGLTLQIIVGYILAGTFSKLKVHIAAFCVVYGLFLTFGEFGPGDNLGLLASKSCATACKGQFYGIAAAIGKIGAFAGTYAFPRLQAHWQDADENATSNLWYTAPFYLGTSMAVLSLILVVFFVQERPADCQAREDAEFREYLRENGFDMSYLGRHDDRIATDELADDYDEKMHGEYNDTGMTRDISHDGHAQYNNQHHEPSTYQSQYAAPQATYTPQQSTAYATHPTPKY